MKLLSETCDEYPVGTDCVVVKGHIIVNGHQYSINTRGINVVLFDYLSGLFEQRRSYDVMASTAYQTDLAAYLNSLPSGKILLMVVKDAILMNNDLALALRKRGVSATFATSPPQDMRLSMAAIVYTGVERKAWEAAVNKAKGQGISIIDKTIKIFREQKQRDECSDEMGIRTGKIPDSSFTGSSVWLNRPDHSFFNARLHRVGAGWCSTANAPVWHYLQVDLGSKKMLTGIAIQGHGLGSIHAVTKFNLKISLDGITWSFMTDEANQTKAFIGSKKTLGETKVNWFRRTHTRFLRVWPTERDPLLSNTNCIRMELFGCALRDPVFFEPLRAEKSESIVQYNSEGFSFDAIAPLSKKITIGISSAANDTTLAAHFEQRHFHRVNETTNSNNGTVVANAATIVKETNGLNKMSKSAMITYSVKEAGYYNFDIGLATRVSKLVKYLGYLWRQLLYGHLNKQISNMISVSKEQRQIL